MPVFFLSDISWKHKRKPNTNVRTRTHPGYLLRTRRTLWTQLKHVHPPRIFSKTLFEEKKKQQRLNKCDSSTSYSTNTEHHQYKTEEISHVDEEKRKHYNHSIYMMHKTWKCKQDTVKIL